MFFKVIYENGRTLHIHCKGYERDPEIEEGCDTFFTEEPDHEFILPRDGSVEVYIENDNGDTVRAYKYGGR